MVWDSDVFGTGIHVAAREKRKHRDAQERRGYATSSSSSSSSGREGATSDKKGARPSEKAHRNRPHSASMATTPTLSSHKQRRDRNGNEDPTLANQDTPRSQVNTIDGDDWPSRDTTPELSSSGLISPYLTTSESSRNSKPECALDGKQLQKNSSAQDQNYTQHLNENQNETSQTPNATTTPQSKPKMTPLEPVKLSSASEAKLIKLLGLSLWRTASQRPPSNLAHKTRPIAELSASNVRRLVGTLRHATVQSQRDFGSYLAQIVKAVNDYDIEMSCYNPLRKAYSLGLRTLVCGICLLDRLLEKVPSLQATQENIHILVVTLMMISSKYSEDEPLNNQLWAKFAGCSLARLDAFEFAIVQLIDYRFRVSEEDTLALLDSWGKLL
mmetsp:Transcript_2753/g.4623  ORF Transcript_2753/g.4623 Transcript_2753/m.4623 type:complete len:385 (-) Transcript_2753:1555-2709(-)|eukprot:CAMPEP_0184558756 /NCGR_PEP_ID=MMETSP0199_2-20130426/46078_1 /TAXON_ID=1112570 /ORGANISM="Thraustochytrium sp., Strain LLF1b" /LENGTH=384 /DNA_ID=CAMNT_0026956025 /DNA_START=534 /DNA_END=1688 /DNA_ORIENTATION=-